MIMKNNTAINYTNDQIININIPSDGLLVMDVNCQGIFDLSIHQARFKTCFPKTYKAFMKLLVEDNVTAGECFFFKEDNYQIALLTTVENLIGKDKDSLENIMIHTEGAIASLTAQLELEESMYMGLINRSININQSSNIVGESIKILEEYLNIFELKTKCTIYRN